MYANVKLVKVSLCSLKLLAQIRSELCMLSWLSPYKLRELKTFYFTKNKHFKNLLNGQSSESTKRPHAALLTKLNTAVAFWCRHRHYRPDIQVTQTRWWRPNFCTKYHRNNFWLRAFMYDFVYTFIERNAFCWRHIVDINWNCTLYRRAEC